MSRVCQRTNIITNGTKDVLEFDKPWSFFLKKVNKRWLLTAMRCRTRQIAAFVIGDHSETACRRLWNKIPWEYRDCLPIVIF